MSSYWSNIISRFDSDYSEDDFEAATYRLVTEQVLYYADKPSRVAYSLIEQYERDFQRALAPMGIVLRINRQSRYACAIPTHTKVSHATIKQTLLALVLRKIYDDAARTGGFAEDGEVECDLIDLQEIYRQMTRMELPGKAELEALLAVMKRWGIARIAEVHDVFAAKEDSNAEQPFIVMIRPGIADVLGEAPLQRLAMWTDIPPEHDEIDDEAGEDEELQA